MLYFHFIPYIVNKDFFSEGAETVFFFRKKTVSDISPPTHLQFFRSGNKFCVSMFSLDGYGKAFLLQKESLPAQITPQKSAAEAALFINII